MREYKITPSSTLLLSVEQTAIVLGLGRTRTYELVMSGRISSIKVGRRRLVVQSSLDAFVTNLLDQQSKGEA